MKLQLLMSQGPNADQSKAKCLRSFVIPADIVELEAYQNKACPDRTQLINIFGGIKCQDSSFIVVDFARLVRFTIISLGRHWQEEDFSPDSEARSSESST